MMPKLSFPTMSRRTFLAGGGCLLAVLMALAVWKQAAIARLASQPNLLTLIGQLGGTTSGMLENTERLHKQVQEVQTKLGELHAQETVLEKQAQTGKELEAALQTQVELTGNGVELMQQILNRETVSVKVTGQVSAQANQLAGHVKHNADQLYQLVGPLNRISQQSAQLNRRMDELLTELQKSKDAFKLFGKLNALPGKPVLPGIIPPLGSTFPPAKPVLPEIPLLPSLPQSSPLQGGSPQLSDPLLPGTEPPLPLPFSLRP